MATVSDSRPSFAAQQRLANPDGWVKAQVIPLAVFMGFMLVSQIFDTFFGWEHPAAPWWRHWPEQWIYPLQTVVAGALLIRFWRFYEFQWSLKWTITGAVFGAVGIGFWLLPTTLYDRLGLVRDPEGWMKWLGIAARTDGFDPTGAFGSGTGGWWAAIVMRFIRAAVVVALVEEIFWRNFLMRFVEEKDGDYWKRPFGQAGWKSWLVVTGLFTVAHQPLDYAGAMVYGSLTWVLCVWSRSLGACVVMHAVANLLMGLYALAFEKYGLW